LTGRFFLVDENISPAIADQLWRRQPKMKVVKIGDEMAPPKGTLDPDILSWIELHGFSLVTRNRNSSPNAKSAKKIKSNERRRLSNEIIGAGIEVHRHLGPALDKQVSSVKGQGC